LQAPLCAVRAGQRIKLVFYIGERKRKKKEKSSEKGVRVCNPLCAPSAQDKRINQVFYIDEDKRKSAQDKK